MKKLFSSKSMKPQPASSASSSIKHSASSKHGKSTVLGPALYVKLAGEGLAVILSTKDPNAQSKATVDLEKYMRDIKEILYGDTERFPNPEVGAQLAAEIFTGDFLSRLIYAVPLLSLETRRDACQIVANLQRQRVNNQILASDYLANHTDVLDHMVQGYENIDTALFYGTMLRDCIRHQSVTKHILESSQFGKFFEYMSAPSFEVASDAAATFKELLTRHKTTVAAFLTRKYDWFFGEYTKMLQSSNYITRRMGIKMLNEILLERAVAPILERYISSLENMKVVMNLLKDPNLSIQVEAIHMFKEFIKNNHRPLEITKVLFVNKDKLTRYVDSFKLEKEDARVEGEIALIKQCLQEIQLP